MVVVVIIRGLGRSSLCFSRTLLRTKKVDYLKQDHAAEFAISAAISITSCNFDKGRMKMMTHHWFIQSRIQSNFPYLPEVGDQRAICWEIRILIKFQWVFVVNALLQACCGNFEASMKALLSPLFSPKPQKLIFVPLGPTTTNLTRRSREECCFCFGKFAHRSHIKFIAFLWSHGTHGIVTKPFFSSFNTSDSVLRLPLSLHYVD